MFMKKFTYILMLAACFLAAAGTASCQQVLLEQKTVLASETLSVTGTFINLPYQDVRNKYTNPKDLDCTSPDLWRAKIHEMKDMGMEYLVFMSVANEQKAYYPSKLMEWHYPSSQTSPVDAIMDAAAELGMKVFMSTGWAKDQDDNLRDPKIKGRQIEMMEELAGLYGKHKAFYGWYLPVEDCFGPVLSDYAVEAVNALTARARELTPAAKIMISPYGIFNSDFDDPRYEQQIARLTVDIIAYQDEIGCVRERYPLPRLRENWKKLRAIHDKTGIEMWANCESFAWEKGTNDRSSALIPAPMPRFLSQLVAASEGGAERIISFVMCGLFEKPGSQFQLGQPYWSVKGYEDYMAWLSGEEYWRQQECYMRSDSATPKEDPADAGWVRYKVGTQEVVIELDKDLMCLDVLMLNSRKDGIAPPDKMFLFTSEDGDSWSLARIKDTPVWKNTNHDAFVDYLQFAGLEEFVGAKYLKLAFNVEKESYLHLVEINK